MPLFDRPPIDAISVSNTLFSQGTFRITGQAGVVSSDGSGASINAIPVLGYFDNAVAASAGLIGAAPQYNTLGLFPLAPANEVFPGAMTVSTMLWNVSHAAVTASSSTNSAAFTSSFMFAIYTLANSSQLSILNSGSSVLTKGAAGANSTLFTGGGGRWITFTSGNWSSIPVFADSHYYMASLVRSAGLALANSFYGASFLSSGQRQGTFGTSSATNTGLGWYPAMGLYTASTAAFPSTIGANQVNQAAAGANFIPHVVFNNTFPSF